MDAPRGGYRSVVRRPAPMPWCVVAWERRPWEPAPS